MGVTIGPGWEIGQGWVISITPSGSIVFSGSNYLTVPNSTAFDQNSSAWTVECFAYPTDSQQGYIYMQNTVGFAGLVYGNGKFMVDQSSVGFKINSPINYPINNWYHVAMTYNGVDTVYLWIDGSLQGTWSSVTGLAASASTTQIASYVSGSQPYRGYISNLRVVKGVAVYTGTYTVPAEPLTATQGSGSNISAITAGQTKLLLNTVTPSYFVDSSDSPITVTNVGSATGSALDPF
jgi:Concanavalin A-like lectin/glucanases superfamily